MKPHVDALTQLLTSIDGQSAVISSAKWGVGNGSAGESYLRGNQIEAPFGVACPCPEKSRQQRFFRKASDRIESIEYTLETLRVMKAFFDGTSLEEILPYVTRIWRAWWMEWFERIRM